MPTRLTEKTTPEIQAIGELRDADKVRDAIKLKYGCDVNRAYCLDLIKFTRAMTDHAAGGGIQVDSLDDSEGLTGE